ncbi:MAG: L-aspartate oxidase [Gammaproteobacteria bacterium]|jgi:L-aspartate oxidase|nr:L-aspartate oxidase [Gammaproteobacteria bacterium]MDH3849212.1 L-aspartate oxidase [Gammaproteobacteria bacterium]MDH3862928.1 L-aspartate oxidase [Gammaproteobacteria bacterium]MDH3905181.1 L-aspartate oxidase [Gammaproteobacteria bacterium]MDH4006205.1 L-aspartate oxidase [Gammaproteobacteria bacterium]
MKEDRPLTIATDDIVVVGTGMAGLITALSLAPRPVTLITKTATLESGSSLWAKGGIAAAVGPGDTPEAHAEDTLSAGAGLSDPRRALALTREGADSLRLLVHEGVPFDRALDGTLELAREAAHGRPRIVHAGGDATGRVIMSALIERARRTPSINILRRTFAHDLIVQDGAVRGLLVFEHGKGWSCRNASHVVLATGGIGMAWWHTTNPAESTGDGLAIAARAGAELTDLEFMQFHPTALAVNTEAGNANLPLLTEALRGAGALLVDDAGERFMTSVHTAAELAPRDVVARTIEQKLARGGSVYLDMRPVVESGHDGEFPEAVHACRDAGLDPAHDLLPIVPAAHYHMGGIHVDDDGHSSLEGLWACGEVANTGVHGANRLASNSLLEAVVYARRVASGIRRMHTSRDELPLPIPGAPDAPVPGTGKDLEAIIAATRQSVSKHVGIVRCGHGLRDALRQFRSLDRRLGQVAMGELCDPAASFDRVLRWSEARNLLLVARLVALAALDREESRGAHFREDFPNPLPEWQRHQSLTVDRLA